MSDRELVFYTHPMSRGRIVRWMLEEVGAPYRTEIVGYGAEMKADAYRAINPMGKVPALTHGETIVTECAAICAYLADAFPQAGLAPPPAERGAYYRWLFFAAGPFELMFTAHTLGMQPDERQQMMVGYGSRDLVIDVLAAAMPKDGYIAGDRFTAADVYLGSHMSFGIEFDALPKRPEFEAYVQRLGAREAYQRAKAIDDALMPEHAPEPH